MTSTDACEHLDPLTDLDRGMPVIVGTRQGSLRAGVLGWFDDEAGVWYSREDVPLIDSQASVVYRIDEDLSCLPRHTEPIDMLTAAPATGDWSVETIPLPPLFR